MCIAILNKTGQIGRKTFYRAWENNPDGGGIAYAHGGKVHVIKEMLNPKVLFEKYKEVRRKHEKAPILIHFRIATHGTITESNCHPFKINDKTAFIHNGIIDGQECHSNKSDTVLFNENILQKLPDNFLTNQAIFELIETTIGYSKLVFLTGDNKYYIANENMGKWDGGNWYSNESYKKQKTYFSTYQYGHFDGYKTTNKRGHKEAESDFKVTCDCCQTSSSSVRYNTAYNIYMCSRCEKEYLYNEYDIN